MYSKWQQYYWHVSGYTMRKLCYCNAIYVSYKLMPVCKMHDLFVGFATRGCSCTCYRCRNGVLVLNVLSDIQNTHAWLQHPLLLQNWVEKRSVKISKDVNFTMFLIYCSTPNRIRPHLKKESQTSTYLHNSM